MLWLWPCKRHVVPSWTLTHEKLCRNRHFQIVRLTESRTFFDFYFSQFFAKIGVFTSSILTFVSTLFKIKQFLRVPLAQPISPEFQQNI